MYLIKYMFSGGTMYLFWYMLEAVKYIPKPSYRFRVHETCVFWTRVYGLVCLGQEYMDLYV